MVWWLAVCGLSAVLADTWGFDLHYQEGDWVNQSYTYHGEKTVGLGMDALVRTGKLTFNSTGEPSKRFVTCINHHCQDKARNVYWLYYVNGTSAPVGMDEEKLQPGDVVAWRLQKTDWIHHAQRDTWRFDLHYDEGNWINHSYPYHGGDKTVGLGMDTLVREGHLAFNATGEHGHRYITCINHHCQDRERNLFWLYTVNGKEAEVGMDEQVLHPKDVVAWHLQKIDRSVRGRNGGGVGWVKYAAPIHRNVTSVTLEVDHHGMVHIGVVYNVDHVDVYRWEEPEWKDVHARLPHFSQRYGNLNLKMRDGVAYVGLTTGPTGASVCNGHHALRGSYAFLWRGGGYDFEIEPSGDMDLFWVSGPPVSGYPDTDNKLVTVKYDKRGWETYPASPAFGPQHTVDSQTDENPITSVRLERAAEVKYVGAYVKSGHVVVRKGPLLNEVVASPIATSSDITDLTIHAGQIFVVYTTESGVGVRRCSVSGGEWVDMGVGVTGEGFDSLRVRVGGSGNTLRVVLVAGKATVVSTGLWDTDGHWTSVPAVESPGGWSLAVEPGTGFYLATATIGEVLTYHLGLSRIN